MFRIKKDDKDKLKEEYNNLVQGLTKLNPKNLTSNDIDMIIPNPTLFDENLELVIPGNIRKADHFIQFLKRFVEYLKVQHINLTHLF